MEIVLLANLSQVVCFISSPVLTVMLTFCAAKWQLIVQSVYACEFILLSIVGIRVGGLNGFVLTGLTANVICFLFVVLVGLIKIKTSEKGETSS